jgi:AraC-like DNA-binding protein
VINSAFVPMAVRIGTPDLPTPFRGHVRQHSLGDLGLVDAESGPCAGSRGPSRIRRSTSDYIAVLILRRGSERVTQDGERALLSGGDVLICDTQRALSFDMTTPAHKQMLLVPRGAIEEVTGRSWPAAAMLLRPDTPATQLLANHLDGLIRTSAELPTDAALAARTATLYLLAGAASPSCTELTADSAPQLLREAMKRWIEHHLLDPDLCPAAVAAAHAMSLRTAQRLFQHDDESLAAYIRRRRLARARAALLSATPISEIAHHYGFYDAGHFTRTFKAEYGTTPASYRADWKHPHTVNRAH